MGSQSDTENVNDLLYVVESADGTWNITPYVFPNDQGPQYVDRPLFRSDTAIDELQIVANGRVLIASAGHRVLIGSKKGAKFSPLKNIHYQWREFNCTDPITSMKGHVSGAFVPPAAPNLDLALGTRGGFIYVYRDIINSLIAAKVSKEPPPVARLHWHRNAVGALDWSKDGNYLVSGGQETVLVLWQMDTGKKSFLPHLSTAIKRIVVSPSGVSYGLSLADGSSMVLKVMTLEPETSVAEPQLFFGDLTAGALSATSTLTNGVPILPHRRTPVSTTSKSTKLFFASALANNGSSDTMENKPPPFLHVYDHKSGAQVSKQALARTLVTDRNVGPHGRRLEEPNVVLLGVSSDEEWLATVDEWLPASEGFHGPEYLMALWRSDHLETLEAHLRFWNWKVEAKSWQMVEKVNLSQDPYSHAFKSSKVILDLASDPIQPRFFTLGDDNTIRAWRPRIREKYGMVVKDEQGNDAYSWTCREIGALPIQSSSGELHEMAGRLAVSHDGSLLVASVSVGGHGVVAAFDLRSRQLLCSHFDKISGPVRGLGVIGSSIYALSDVFAVWNFVDSTKQHMIDMRIPGARREQLQHYTHVACDPDRDVLAIVTPTMEHSEADPNGYSLKGVETRLKDESTMIILAGNTLTPQATIHLPFLTLSLLPAPTQRGFLAISTNSEMILITSSIQPSASVHQNVTKALQPVGLGKVFGNIPLHQPNTESHVQSGPQLENGDGIISMTGSTPREQGQQAELLKRIFDGSQPLSTPTVLSMFRQVAAAMSRDTREAA